MWEQIESNKRKSVLIVTVMGVILIGLGMALGQLFTGQQQGALLGGAIAFGIWLLLWLFTRSQGDDVMLQMAGARRDREAGSPAAVQHRGGNDDRRPAAQDAARVHRGRPLAQRLCRRTRSGQGVSGRDDRAVADAQSRRIAGCGGPRDRAHQESRCGADDHRRHHARRDRDPGRLRHAGDVAWAAGHAVRATTAVAAAAPRPS